MTDAIHVLHVDDDPDFAAMAATFLERADDRLTVDTITSAIQGHERLATQDYDCIISDYDMPGLDGIEFLEIVREDYPELPFILYTGKGSEEVASDAIRAGATDYLQKASGTEQYELLANRLCNSVEQYRSTRRAAALDRIRTLASDINHALVRASSRKDAELRVCEIFTNSDPYQFAWIGELNQETKEIEPKTSAGGVEGYLKEITVTADESPTGQGPGGRAVREGRVVVSQNITEDPEFEPWREQARDRGFQAVAAVPLEFEDSLYGILAVYADRAHAFDEDERTLLAEVGEDISHVFRSFEVQSRLRKERDRRRALFENAPTPVMEGRIDKPDTHYIADINESFEEVFGFEAAEIVGTDVAGVIIPEEGQEQHEGFRKQAEAGEPTFAEVERLTVDGLRDFLLINIPYGNDEGIADGWYSWFTDITERKERAQAIEELHDTTEALMEAESREGVATITVEAVRDILGMPANGVHLFDEEQGGLIPVAWTERTEELVGVPPTFSPGEGIAGVAFRTGEPQIYDDISSVSDRYDSDSPVRSQIALPLGDHGVLLIGSPEVGAFDVVDVSLAGTLAAHVTTALGRLEREAELIHQRELFAATLETTDEGILVTDDNGEFVTWNAQFVEMWGMPEEILRDKTIAEGLEWVRDQVDDPESLIGTVEYLQENPEEESREVVRLRDGRIFTGYSGPVESVEGTHFGRVWCFHDVTDRKRRTEELQVQNERLEKFASVVSHDLRSPLTVAQGKLELASEECESEYLAGAADAVDRCISLVDDLQELASEGGRMRDLEVVDLPGMVEACWRNVASDEASLTVETGQSIRADQGRLKQLLENLFRNAIEHGGTGVTVRVGDLDSESGFFVADDGGGIPEAERDAVFERGMTTSTAGSGFGLSIVKEVAEEHGWNVRVTESASDGARFEVSGVTTAD